MPDASFWTARTWRFRAGAALDAALLRLTEDARWAYNEAVAAIRAGARPNAIQLESQVLKAWTGRRSIDRRAAKGGVQQAVRRAGSGVPPFHARGSGGTALLPRTAFDARTGTITLGRRSVVLARALEQPLPDHFAQRSVLASWYPTSRGRMWTITVFMEARRETEPVSVLATGVDVGLRPLAVVSDGEQAKSFSTSERESALIARLTASLEHKRAAHPGVHTKAQEDAARRLRAAKRRRWVRTRQACREAGREAARARFVGLEKLDFTSLAPDVSAHMGMVQRIIREEAGIAGRTVLPITAARTSQRCSICGQTQTDLGREPAWSCPSCGTLHDRNENAARNISQAAANAARRHTNLGQLQAG